MKKTKLFAVIGCLIMTVSLLTGCGQANDAEEAVGSVTEESAEAVVPETDGSEMIQESANDVIKDEQEAEQEDTYDIVVSWMNEFLEKWIDSGASSVRTYFAEEQSDGDIDYFCNSLMEALQRPDIDVLILSEDDDRVCVCVGFQWEPDSEDDIGRGRMVLVKADDGFRVTSDFGDHSCGSCGGAGVIAQTSGESVCAICGGTGQQYIPNAYYDSALNTWQGQYMVCSGCGGSGYFTTYRVCNACGGFGII